ncbi:MAG: hypothetical protein K2Z81_08830, partial [Cyanobacteria bacterium]|nr:hypothetical protein [Cyanobacteriota bacterium]
MKATFTYFLGLFLVALSTVMYEVLLTRIFSVTTWYHFAFLAITLAMLGMTVGAIIVYLKPNLFTEEKTHHFSAVSAVCFALTSIAAVLVHIYSPALIPSNDISSIIFGSLFASLPILLIAFAFSGICISLALTRFPSQVNALYAADLIGAAIGSSGIVFMLQIVDGISLALLVGALNCIAAVFFVWGRKDTRTMAVSLALGIGLIVLTVINSGSNPLLAITWTKGIREGTVLYQKWNSFSRVRVIGDADRPYRPLGSFSSTIPDTRVQQLSLDIDGCAQTVLTRYTGDKKDASHLPYDVVNMVHYLRPQSKVLVIGMGGGRDMLSALVMDQPSVTGVEINPNIIKAVNETFGDFTGHLDRLPNVKFVNDEARSHITRSKQLFDIIEMSFIDTWAATASGAYVLTENALYTVEGWDVFLNHLSPNGIFSVSRWYE